ncbi:MAG: hypothetical protein IPK64_00160 [bacterium]|nr:hypothetical protein [bacterium]
MARFWALVLALLTVGACAPGAYYQGRQLLASGAYEEATAAFQRELSGNPLSAAAWREAGVARYHLGRHAAADSALAEAARLGPDERTRLYQGLVREALGDQGAALGFFRQVLASRPDRETRRLAHLRFETLVRQRAERLAQDALAAERDGRFTGPPDNTIAVVAFDGADLPAELAPLARGLAEFLALDLGKIASLRVVERLQIEQLIRELALANSDLADPDTRLRTGRLLGSRRVVTGSLQAPGNGRLEAYSALADVVAAESRDLDGVTGDESGFFRLEKDLVFDIIDDLGITITAAERDAIQKVPTESFTAVLAYSRGLLFHEQGRYAEAAAEFQKAHQADGGFQEAGVMAEMTGDVALATATGAAPGPGTGTSADEQSARLLTALQGESGIMPTFLGTDAGGPPDTAPPRTGAVTGVRIIVGGDFR